VSELPRDGSLAGRVIVVVGDDGAAVGKAVGVLTDAGARAAACVGDPLTDAVALVEMVAELFPHPEPGAPEPA
jgi:hypothetical protein